MTTTMTEKKFYTQEDLLAAMSKLPENEAKNILENMKISTILDFLNVSYKEQREQLKNSFSEALHRELDIYNGMNRLYDMFPVLECKMYVDEGVVQKNENASSESTCDNQIDVVE
ncbi:MAG: hypothetical protein NC312_09200 [Bacteroides fragilis]|nr:hypothetical protein [Bacteroides fragilis]